MVIDSSVVLAILLGEEDDGLFAFVIDADPTRMMSAVSVLESIVVETRKGAAAGRQLDLFLHRGRIDVVPFNVHQLELARDAYRRYGKGYHRAALNIGDCCSYALAAASGEPLLLRRRFQPNRHSESPWMKRHIQQERGCWSKRSGYSAR
jgi:ribonuclease VapC